MLDLENMKLKRDPNLIKKYTKPSGDLLITKKPLYIIFPTKFVDKDLSIIGTTSYILGIVAIMDEDGNYAVSTIPARIEVQPFEVNNVLYNNVEYTIMKIEEGDALYSNKKIIKEKKITFDIFDVLYLQGKVPFYLEYMDFVKIFSNLKKYTDSNAANDIITFELLTSIITRSPNDPNTEYREILNSLQDLNKIKPSYVGLQNIWYTFKSTISKIAGSYMKLGIVSAIINPEKDISNLEHVVRE